MLFSILVGQDVLQLSIQQDQKVVCGRYINDSIYLYLLSSFQADIAGTVLSTIKQRDLVTAPPTVIIDIASSDLPSTPPMPSLPSFNFDRLILLLNTYLVTWREGSIFIFHPSSYSLSNWSNQFQGIVDVICVNEKVIHTSIFKYKLSIYNLAFIFYHPLIICLSILYLSIHLFYHLSLPISSICPFLRYTYYTIIVRV